MSRPASALNAGQTNKKFIYMALGLGLLGAILVYAAFSRGGGSDGSSGADRIPVVVAKEDIEARTKITASMVEVKLLPADDASASLAYSDTANVVGKITRFPIAANEQVLSNKVVDLSTTASAAAGKSLSFVVPPGMRAIAVTVKDVTNAGGLLLPGDYVDILVVYDIEFSNDPSKPGSHEKADSFLVQTLFQKVEVLAVSQTLTDIVPEDNSANGSTQGSGQRVRNTEAKPAPDAKTVTVALSAEDAQKLYLAESNGRIRFTVRPFGDQDTKPIDLMIEPDLFPRNLPNPFIR